MKLVDVTIKGQMWIPDEASDEQIQEAVESIFHDNVIETDNPMKDVDWLDYDVTVSR